MRAFKTQPRQYGQTVSGFAKVQDWGTSSTGQRLHPSTNCSQALKSSEYRPPSISLSPQNRAGPSCGTISTFARPIPLHIASLVSKDSKRSVSTRQIGTRRNWPGLISNTSGSLDRRGWRKEMDAAVAGAERGKSSAAWTVDRSSTITYPDWLRLGPEFRTEDPKLNALVESFYDRCVWGALREPRPPALPNRWFSTSLSAAPPVERCEPRTMNHRSRSRSHD
jgi:hypothetical protein